MPVLKQIERLCTPWVLALCLGLALTGCGGSDADASRDPDSVEAVSVTRVSPSEAPDTALVDAAPVVLEAPALDAAPAAATAAAPGVKPSYPSLRIPSHGPAMVFVHQGASGLMAGQRTHARAWVLRSQTAWRKLWEEHLQIQPEGLPDVPAADFRARMVVGVAAWGADAAGRVEIQSVVRLGPVLRVVFKVVGRCPESATFVACRRDVAPVHHFVSVPMHNGAVQFVMASEDEPEMSWTSNICPAKNVTWTVNGHVCNGRVERTVDTSQHTAFNVTSGLTGHQMLFCERNAAQAVWWTAWRSGGWMHSVNCYPTPPPPPPLTDPLEIATAKNCLNCHTVDGRDILGPSFKHVADFYRNNPPAEGQLERKIKAGSAGLFGTFPMPANSQINDRELAIVVPWILGLQ